MNHMESRTRPGPHQPDPDVTALRALRQATSDYILVLTAGYQALTDAAIARSPGFVYLRTALAIATGKRGSGGLGTPIGIESMLSKLLGEAEEEASEQS